MSDVTDAEESSAFPRNPACLSMDTGQTGRNQIMKGSVCHTKAGASRALQGFRVAMM